MKTVNYFIELAQCTNGENMTLDQYVQQTAQALNISESEVFELKLSNDKLKWIEEFLSDESFLKCVKPKLKNIAHKYDGDIEKDTLEMGKRYPNFASILPAILTLTIG